ncbi:O-antigen ligase family protein [Vibrio cholerae]
MDRVDKRNISKIDFLSIIWFAFVLSLGGLKFFIFSPLFNMVIAFIGFALLIYNFKNVIVNTKSLLFLLLLLLFFFIIFSSFFFDLSEADFTYVLKIISLVIFSFTAFILSFYIAQNPSLLALILSLFGALMSALFIVKYIRPSGAGELSYLNLALPIGIGLLSSIYYLINKGNGFLNKLYILFLITIQCVAILSLSARMVLISVALILMFMLIRNLTNRWIVLMTAGLCITLYYFSDGIVSHSDFLMFKIERLLENYKEEPRFNVYMKSIELILSAPFGYGLQSYYKLLGFYPHNIFIEILLSSGIFAFIIFLILFAYAFLNALKFLFHQDLSIYAIVFIYFSIQWNFSYDFSSSYALLASLCVVAGIVLNKASKNEDKHSNYYEK